MNKKEKAILHDIIIDLRKALQTGDDEVRAEVIIEIDRLYELIRNH